MTVTPLSLPEEILLVALHDEKGTAPQPNTDYALSAAAIVGLLEVGRLEVGQGKKSQVAVVDPSPTGDLFLDGALMKLVEQKPRRLSSWIERLARSGELRDLTATRLIERGILERHQGAFFGLGSDRYPERDGSPEAVIRSRVEQAVVTDGYVDEETRLLVSVLHGSELLSRVVPAKEIRRRKARLAELAEGDGVSAALQQALQEMHAALMAATTAAT